MSTGRFFASRSADGEKKVNASCQSGCSARSVSSTGLACSPSPTDGACIQISGRFVSRCAAAHAARRAANPRRPSSPRATFLSKRATSGAARVTTCTLSRHKNEGLLTLARACARRKSNPTNAASGRAWTARLRARRTLEVRHLVDGDWCVQRAFGAGGERILVLRAPAADEQRRGEEEGIGAKTGQGPDFVQMAMTPHWESDLRNSAGASLGLR